MWILRYALLTGFLVIVLMMDPDWQHPYANGGAIVGTVLLATGPWLRGRRSQQFWFAGVTSVLAGVAIDWGLGNLETSFLYVWLAVYFALIAHWSWNTYPIWAHRFPSRSLPWPMALFAPSSWVGLSYALASFFVGATLFQAYVERDLAVPGIVAGFPWMLLAVGFWYQQDWIRWFGPIVCLLYVPLVILLALSSGPETYPYSAIIVIGLIELARQLRNWHWEHY